MKESSEKEEWEGYERFPNLGALIQVHDDTLRQMSMPELTAVKPRTPGRGSRMLQRATSWANRLTTPSPRTSLSRVSIVRRRQSEPGAGEKQ